MAKKILLILLAAMMLSGCGESLKQGWDNFSAYYNTFYNAKKYFEEGLQSVREQPVEIQPESIVRVHRAPPPAEDEAFKQAIAKCVQLLRSHPDSRWRYPALLIMGQSNYYLNDFIAALDQFEELQTSVVPTDIRRQAVIWKGRTLLDLHNYNEGLRYLEAELQQYPSEGPASYRGKLQILAAEHHALLEQWKEAASLLSRGITNLSDEQLLGRSYFLYGQVLERQQRLAEAYHAYRQAGTFFAGYEYAYHARLKQADVARRQNRLDTALALYRDMLKNDKYFERRDRLRFEIAQTLEMQGQTGQAEQYYYRLLYGDNNSELRNLQAEIYYHLGRIQSEEYQNYTLAAAYFDTSASLRNQQAAVSGTDETPSLADAYRHYVALKQSIVRTDSLLWLGALPPDKRDSVIARIVDQRKQQLLAQQRLQDNRLENQPTTIVNEQDSTVGNMTTVYGFLNYENEGMVARGQAGFRAIWGDRPLADNWRLREAIPQSKRSETGANGQEVPADSVAAVTPPGPLPDWEAIPETPAERDSLNARRARLQYQLGNVLFLDLAKPDSAKIYYHKVIKNRENPSLHPRAMYALYELFRQEGPADSLGYWKDQITARFPRSVYARLVTTGEGQGISGGFSSASDSLRNRFHALQKGHQPDQADRLRALALSHLNAQLAPHIHYSAIEQYIRDARTYQAADDLLLGQKAVWQEDSLSFEPAPGAMLLPPDSTFTATYWDNVRMALEEHDSLFAESPYQSEVAMLRNALQRDAAKPAGIATCADLGIRLQPVPNMETFMQKIEWKRSPSEPSISGEVVYSFVVDRTGRMLSYKLESPRTDLGIEEALEAAFQDSFRFQSLDIRQELEQLRCRVAFPINR